MSAPRISVVLLTLDEEIHIERALRSVAWSDDVIVVDSFSTDRTEEICGAFPNVTFVTHPFTDLAAQRNHPLEAGLVRHDWVLALDADEYVTSELADELQTIAGDYEPGAPVAYDIAMRIIEWGRWLRWCTGYPHTWRRFFRKELCHYVQRGHAEKLEVDGPIGRTRHDLMHEDLKGLEAWLDKHNRYSTQEAQLALEVLPHVPLSDLFHRDRERRKLALKRVFRALPFNASLRFLYLYVVRLGFLDGRRGFRFCRLKAYQNYIIQLKMAEARRRGGTHADARVLRIGVDQTVPPGDGAVVTVDCPPGCRGGGR